MLETSDFDYDLPSQLIAQKPVTPRDSSRLLVLDRRTGTVVHRSFRDIQEFLRPGDRLILNNTKVLHARLFCTKSTGARIEVLFVEKLGGRTWRVMANPGRRLKLGTLIRVRANAHISFTVKQICDNGDRILTLNPNSICKTISQVIEKYGVVPLPPYIKRAAGKRDSHAYQTVYAEKAGAIAAPTAGLHFTKNMISSLKKKGIGISFVTLHVGPGTFAPVKETDPRKHVMHSEVFELSRKTANDINRTVRAGGRIVAVGTTVVRVLEHCARIHWPLQALEGTTDLMIVGPYRFRAVDVLLTNFHLPCSTLLMLVSAFGGRERVLRAYREAARLQYRFYSYGDAMLVY